MTLAEDGEEGKETTQFYLRRDNSAMPKRARISSPGNRKWGDKVETLGAPSTRWLALMHTVV